MLMPVGESRAPDTKENAVAATVVSKEMVAGIATTTAAADNKTVDK